MKLLHIDSSITGEASVSRRVSAAIVARLREEIPGLAVTRRDLARDPLSHLTLSAADEAILDEFLAADVVVIGAPMYNFTIASQLKAWLDRILVAGRTFRYGPNGPEGLAGGKRVILAISRGGLYGAGAPGEALEHLETYLRGVFGFIGIAPEVVLAEGLNLGPEQREAALGAALQQVEVLAAA
jgi:FMN-dependent NADH-azoreductase